MIINSAQCNRDNLVNLLKYLDEMPSFRDALNNYKQHFLNFLLLPQGQSSFLPTRGVIIFFKLSK